jgi:aryl-alcohol dehydrogenase-like predicted oxidoreductase
MPLDQYMTLGHSGLCLSAFGLGAMTFGEKSFGTDAAESGRIMDRFIERGGNFIDTSNQYARGRSEEIIGGYLGSNRTKRDRLVIATKYSKNLDPKNPNSGGASRKSVTAACEASLGRLRTDYIDLYWQHYEDLFAPLEETMRALDDLVRSGKVRYLGFSDAFAWKVVKAQLTAQHHGWNPLVALQIEYSLLERTVEGELIPMALDMRLGVTPWSPLRGGMLSGKYGRENMQAESAGRAGWIGRDANERAFCIVDTLRSVARRCESTPARVALAWLRAQPGVTAPIIGARTIAQLEDNLAALHLALAPEDIAELNRVSNPTLNFPADFLRVAGAASYGGMTVNGRTFGPDPVP